MAPGNAFGDVWPGEIPPGWELELGAVVFSLFA
jgi:hypothetical protein